MRTLLVAAAFAVLTGCYPEPVEPPLTGAGGTSAEGLTQAPQTGTQRVYVSFKRAPQLDERNLLSRHGATVVGELSELHLVEVEIDAADLPALSAEGLVERVEFLAPQQ